MLRATARTLGYLAVFVLVLVVLVVGSAALWFPNLNRNKAQIEAYLSDALGHPVVLSSIETEWDGLTPQLRASGLNLQTDPSAPQSVRLDELRMRIDLLSFLRGKLVLDELILVRPAIEVVRQADRRLVIPGVGTLDSGSGFLRWVSSQDNISIENGELTWRDLLDTEPQLTLSGIDMQLRGTPSGFRIGVRTASDNVLAQELRADIDVDDSAAAASGWSSTLRVQASDASVAALRRIFAIESLEGLTGRADLDLELRLDQGRLTAVRGPVRSASLYVPVQSRHEPLPVARVGGVVDWAATASGWEFHVEDLELRTAEAQWVSGDFGIVRARHSTEMQAGAIRLDPIPALLDSLEEPPEFLHSVVHARPTGTLRNVKLQFQGDWSKPEAFSMVTDVENLTLEAHASYPGITGLNAHVVATKRGAEMTIGGAELEVWLPRYFREPMHFIRPEGRMMLQYTEDQWLVTGENVRLANPDISVLAQFQLHTDTSSNDSPFLRMSAQFDQGNVAHAAKYYPARIMPPRLLSWLERALTAGTLTDGSMNLEGRLGDFPFVDADGKFEVVASISDGVLDYAAAWPRLEAARGQLKVENASLVVSGESGIVGGLDASGVTARIKDLRNRDPHLELQGRLHGGFGLVVDFLKDGPVLKGAGLSALNMVGEGNGALDLDIDLPLRELAAFKLAGAYAFEGSRLGFANGVAVSDMGGRLEFSETDIRGQSLTGRILGGETRFSVNTTTPGRAPEVVIDATGNFSARELTAFLGPTVADNLGGVTQWRGDITLAPGRARLMLESALAGATIDLPHPVGKTKDEWVPSVAEIDYEVSGTQHTRFQIGDRINGALVYGKRDGRWKLDRGEIIMGAKQARVPYGPDLHLGVYLTRFDLDRWLRAFPLDSSTTEKSPAAPVRRIHSDVGQLTAFGRKLGALRLTADQTQRDHWRGVVVGPGIEGKGDIRWAPNDRQVWLEFERLYLTKAEPAPGKTSPDPRNLPQVDLVSKDFRYGNMQLGALELHLLPTTAGSNIRQLQLTRPELALDVSGAWNYDGEHHTSSFRGTFTSRDLGLTLGALGFPDQIEEGQAVIEANLSWEGSPGRFDFAHLNGDYLITASNGRFLKVNPGTGRLIGLLNAEALIRRLSLDFSDVFSKGLAFDEITGQGTLEEGDLYTDGFFIAGPAALIEARGRTGLAKEDFDLELVVAPQVGGNLSLIGGVLTGAAYGAVIFLAQKLFKKQLAKLVRYKYTVVGPWAAPDVQKIIRMAPGNGPESDVQDK